MAARGTIFSSRKKNPPSTAKMSKHLWFTINFLLIYDLYIRMNTEWNFIKMANYFTTFARKQEKEKNNRPSWPTLPFVIYGKNFHIIFDWTESTWKWYTTKYAKINKQTFSNDFSLLFSQSADGLVIVWIIKFISSVFAQIDHKNIKTMRKKTDIHHHQRLAHHRNILPPFKLFYL